MKKSFTLCVVASALASAALPVFASTPKAMSLSTTTPLIVDFTTWDAASFSDNFTVENGNNDASFWKYLSGWPAIGAQFGNGVAAVTVSTLDNKPANDEWLITKTPVHLEAGKTYMFKTAVGCYGTNSPETFEIKIGTGSTSAGLTEEILPRTTVKTEFGASQEYSKTISVATTGDYYLGYHSTSTWTEGYYLFVFNFSLTSNDETTAPVAPAAPKVTPAADGSHSAVVSVETPEKSITDGTLSTLTSVELYRDDNKVHTWPNATPGTTLTWTDSDGLTIGSHEWYATATNAAGTSTPSDKTSAFIGLNIPSAAEKAMASRTDKPGEIRLTWEAPAVDKDGYPINAASLKYRIVEITDKGLNEIADDVAATIYTYQAVAADAAQELKQYFIYAKTSAGECATPANTNEIPVGKAITLPYTDSFANGAAAYPYQIEKTLSAKWGFYNSYYVAQDGDKGLTAFTGGSKGDIATLMTYNIDLPADINNPILSFYYSGRTVGNNNQLDVLIDAGNGFEQFVNCNQIADGAWHRVIVKLDAYKGKTIRVAFKGEYVNTECILVDALSIASRAKKNVAITGYSIPKTMYAAADNEINAVVTNIGSEPATGITVNLIRNDKVVESKTIGSLATEAAENINFTENLPVTVNENNSYRVEVVFDGDEDTSDNTIQNVAVHVEYPTLPKVSDLKATVEGSTATLIWSKPSFEGSICDYITEDFEDADSWAKDTAAGWTLVDRDNTPNISACTTGNNSTVAEGVVFPGISGQVTSFFVLDDTDQRKVFKAHSGHKSLCSETTYVTDETDANNTKAKKDDWMISPELSGTEQTVSFYVRSTNQNSKEQFEVYTSDENDINPSNFTFAKSYFSIPAIWVKMEASLPAGTRRFAIRCTSDDCAEFLIDDITYMPTYEAHGIDIVGYNVYCNNEKITDTPITETTFSEELGKDDQNRYAVTCVYNKGGESSLSNVVAASISGIDDVETSDYATIAAMPGIIEVNTSASMPVSIYTLDGCMIFNRVCEGKTTVEVAGGIYIVRAGHKTVKVAVR